MSSTRAEQIGGQAYNVKAYGAIGDPSPDGMMLRDYFAAQALPELIRLSMQDDGGWSMDTAAQGAYEMADAMIRTRDARGES